MSGTLNSLFASQVFPLDLLISYLSQSQAGTQDYLVSLLYQFRIEQIEAFLAQLLYLALHVTESDPLASFLLDSCVWSSKFALKLYWQCIAAKGDCLLGQEDLIVKLTRECEYTIVNGARSPVPSDFQPPHLFQLDIDEAPDFQANHKQVRAEMFTISIQLATALCEVSVNLASHEASARNSVLQVSLANIGKWLADERDHYSSGASEYTQRLLRGAYLPIDFCNSSKLEQIVSILTQESFCYFTRVRVPFCVLVETVQMDDSSIAGQADAGEIISPPDSDLSQVELTLHEIEGPWGERWVEKTERISKTSTFSNISSWRLRGFIVKGLDDLRQEFLAMQFIKTAKLIFAEARVSLWLQPYDILVISHDSGLIELVPDALSLDSLKKNCSDYSSLREFFHQHLDLPFEDAQKNFVESMAGYSLICYLLNLKDRHNGNILLDRLGHIIHIDYGFMLTNSPGKNMGFETAPFKLNEELAAVMDGTDSAIFNYFKVLMLQGMLALRQHADKLLLPFEAMYPGEYLPCFKEPSKALKELRGRFMLDRSDKYIYSKVEKLVKASVSSWTTAKYDSYQRYSNGIL